MKIISLELNNTRKVKAFSKELNGENLHIAGDTAQGKTTVINALWEILEKKSDSLTHGESKGEIKIKLSDGSKTIIAKRINTGSYSKVQLVDSNASEISIKDFKKMISDLSVNPHKIMNMQPKDQVEILLKAAKVDIDLNKVDLEIKKLEEKRLDSDRAAKLLQPGEEPEKVEEQNLNDLLSEKDKLEKENISNQNTRKLLKDYEEDLQITKHNITVKNQEIKELQKQIKQHQHKLDLYNQDIEGLTKKINKGIEIVNSLQDNDLTEITEKLANVQEHNTKAIAYKNWVEKNKAFEAKKKEHEKYKAQVKELQQSKKESLNNAKFPINGLTIEDGKVYYNDCLLENLGQSEQILVCSALAINDIKNHDIKVVRLDGVESMSKKDLSKLCKLFNDKDIQVLTTRVSRGDKEENEILIVDGSEL